MDTINTPKALILQEAQQQFFNQGYSKVLMADLAKQLGMSKKTLYQYFRGKEELLHAVIKNYLEELQRDVESLLQQEASNFVSKAEQVFRTVGQRFARINGQLLTDIRKHTPKTWQLLQQYRAEAAFKRFKTLLDEGNQKGFIRKDANISLAVLLYASALEKILDPEFISQVPPELMQDINYTPSAVYEGLASLIFHGLLEKK
ncbi:MULTISPECIES: TetR/AcrR family transcriptional regulator [Pontibacter]|uniref:Transcriptional regulator, TetR family n=1 Tax=Pontibacter lucknowensis TaxID=1077936 RepID=A0A1N6Y2B1_9BACT|nr:MULTISPECIES: TetR/AcrR family transcriptional regulator [Pontibacter]EJF11216.1 TetR family transcriptional regulator [Pontibacter sp. BAB1700]SIR08700.1 transcriptional regulator, TetR family [Pontibacter lucknowensis]